MSDYNTELLDELLNEKLGCFVSYPRQYQREPEDYGDAGGFVWVFSLLTAEEDPNAVKRAVAEALGDYYYRGTTSPYDCSGQMFSHNPTVIVGAGVNVYGDEHLKDLNSYNITYQQEFSLDV